MAEKETKKSTEEKSEASKKGKEAAEEKKQEQKAEKKAKKEGKGKEKNKGKGEAKSKEEKPILERLYTISLRRAFEKPRTKRRKRAIQLIRSFVARHTHAIAVKIDNAVNALIWKQSKPPRRIKVKVVKDKDGVARVMKG